MKKCLCRTLPVLFLSTLLLILPDCGGGSSSGSSGQQDPPLISSVTFSPTTASLASMPIPTVYLDISFYDAGGNVSTMTKIVHHPDGSDDAKTYSLSVPHGVTSGTMHGYFLNVSEPQVGDYVVSIYLADSAGASSNAWKIPFTVTP
jgi:hypothetical protein